MTIPFSVESKVRCRNQVWEVLKVTDNTDGSWTVRLYPENGSKPQSFLFPHTPIEPIGSALDNLQAGRIDHIDHYRLLTSATRLALVYEYDKLLSISNSKMIPEPYQLLAVKKVMESLRQRFLIADDVGLGKTIEAGLIMQELAARQRGDRVLIVVPAALQDQWKKEMQRHFLRSFYVYNSRKLEGIQELVDENLNPWLAKNSIITSIDWVKPQYQGTGTARRNINRVFDQLMKVEKRWELVTIEWKGSWLNYGPWLSQPREISTFSEPRVLVREVTGRYPKMLLAAPTIELYLNNKSILNVICRPQSQYTPWVITGILNSKLGSFIFKHSGVKANRGLFPKVVIADLQKFPVPRTLDTLLATELEAVVRSMCDHVHKTNVRTRHSRKVVTFSIFHLWTNYTRCAQSRERIRGYI